MDTTKTKIKGLGDLLRLLADLCDKELCDNLDAEVIDSATETLKKCLDVKVDYKQASQITGLGTNALICRMSRRGGKLIQKKYFPISVLKDIGCNVNLHKHP